MSLVPPKLQRSRPPAPLPVSNIRDGATNAFERPTSPFRDGAAHSVDTATGDAFATEPSLVRDAVKNFHIPMGAYQEVYDRRAFVPKDFIPKMMPAENRGDKDYGRPELTESFAMPSFVDGLTDQHQIHAQQTMKGEVRQSRVREAEPMHTADFMTGFVIDNFDDPTMIAPKHGMPRVPEGTIGLDNAGEADVRLVKPAKLPRRRGTRAPDTAQLSTHTDADLLPSRLANTRRVARVAPATVVPPGAQPLERRVDNGTAIYRDRMLLDNPSGLADSGTSAAPTRHGTVLARTPQRSIVAASPLSTAATTDGRHVDNAAPLVRRAARQLPGIAGLSQASQYQLPQALARIPMMTAPDRQRKGWTAPATAPDGLSAAPSGVQPRLLSRVPSRLHQRPAGVDASSAPDGLSGDAGTRGRLLARTAGREAPGPVVATEVSASIGDGRYVKPATLLGRAARRQTVHQGSLVDNGQLSTAYKQAPTLARTARRQMVAPPVNPTVSDGTEARMVDSGRVARPAVHRAIENTGVVAHGRGELQSKPDVGRQARPTVHRHMPAQPSLVAKDSDYSTMPQTSAKVSAKIPDRALRDIATVRTQRVFSGMGPESFFDKPAPGYDSDGSGYWSP